MRTNSLLLVLLCTVMLAAGQVLFKAAALKFGSGERLSAVIVSAISNPYLILGLAIYAVATGLWIWILRDEPLSLAYPITALAFIIVPLLSVVVFKEPFHAKYIYGGMFIVIGVYLVAR